jgi:hypothetical protein
VSEWQPIETAPKDGGDIMVCYQHCDSWFVHIAFWLDGEGVDEEDVGWWAYTLSEVSRMKLDDIWTPTYWQPKPQFPELA